MAYTIIKRNGQTAVRDISKIQKQTIPACEGLKNVSHSDLETSLRLPNRDGILTTDIQKELIRTAMDKIDVDTPAWSFVASRLMINDIEHTSYHYAKNFKDYVNRAVSDKILTPLLTINYNAEELTYIGNLINNDMNDRLTHFSVITLQDRYLKRHMVGNVNTTVETPQMRFMVTAMFIAMNESKDYNFEHKKSNRLVWVEKFYNLLSTLEAMTATPTLANSATLRPQLSSCYVTSTPDCIEGVFDTYRDFALLSKYGGGIGSDWSLVRGAGHEIDGVPGVSGGNIPFLKIANDTALAVDQLGCVNRNSFVTVITDITVRKDNVDETLDFTQYYSTNNLTDNEVLESVASHASNIAGNSNIAEKLNIDNNIVRQIIFESIATEMNIEYVGTLYKIGGKAVKQIIRMFNNLHKSIPDGFVSSHMLPNALVCTNGIVLNADTFKRLRIHPNNNEYVVYISNLYGVNVADVVFYAFNNNISYNRIVTKDNPLDFSLSNLEPHNQKGVVDGRWKGNFFDAHDEIFNHITNSHATDYEIRSINTGTKYIHDVKINDLIESFNIKSQENEFKPVTAKHEITVKTESQRKVSFSDDGFIITSAWHPFPVYNEDKESYTYVKTEDVMELDLTVNELGEIVHVTSVDILDDDASTDFFDLTVRDNNNYFTTTEDPDHNFHLIHNTRKGAIAVYLDVTHTDMMDFLDLKKNSGKTLPFHMVTYVETV